MRKIKTGLLVAVVLLGGCNGMNLNNTNSQFEQHTQTNAQENVKPYRVIEVNTNSRYQDNVLKYYYIKNNHVHSCVTDDNTIIVEPIGHIPKSKKLYAYKVTPNGNNKYCKRVEYIQNNY